MHENISENKMKKIGNVKETLKSETGAVDSSFITVIAIVLAAVLMFIFPLMSMSQRTDDVSQIAVQTATEEFVIDVRTSGKITDDKLDKYLTVLYSTGNSYDVQITVDVLDENPGKKTAQVSGDKIGENITYSIYTSQVEQNLERDGYMLLKEGDNVKVEVKNTNTTIAQMFLNVFYSITGNDTYAIAASSSGIVTTTGK